MVKIFVIGASGYFGEYVSVDFRRRGHEVYGLVRSEEKAKTLLLNEVIPVIGDVSKPETYEQVVKIADVIVYAAQDWSQGTELDRTAFNNVTNIAKTVSGPKKLFIFTSGGRVYASSDKEISEESPLDKIPVFDTRLAVEQELLHSKVFDGVVFRPPFVLGGARCLHWTLFYKQALENKTVKVPGDGKNIIAHIHVSDLAEAYAKTIEADRKNVAGQVFVVSEEKGYTQAEVAAIFAEGAGVSNVKVETGLAWPNPIYEINGTFNSSKAKKLLGWAPKHNLKQDAKVMYNTFKASGAAAEW